MERTPRERYYRKKGENRLRIASAGSKTVSERISESRFWSWSTTNFSLQDEVLVRSLSVKAFLPRGDLFLHVEKTESRISHFSESRSGTGRKWDENQRKNRCFAIFPRTGGQKALRAETQLVLNLLAQNLLKGNFLVRASPEKSPEIFLISEVLGNFP